MSLREILFAVALAVSGALLVVGAALVAQPAGFITAAVVLAVWSWLILSGADETAAVEVDE